MKKLSISILTIFLTLTSISAWSNPGFKDLIPGIIFSEIQQHCYPLVIKAYSHEQKNRFNEDYVECYGIDNIKFRGFGEILENQLTLIQLNINMGPIVTSNGTFFSELNNLVVSNNEEPNIYLKMRKNFNSKYVLDFEYSERDRQLFNKGEKEDLLSVYSNGKVAIRMNHNKENSNSGNLWLFIEYRDVDSAKSFLEENRPITATLDDF